MVEVQRFSAWDYVVFGAMLMVSASIGIYSAFTGGRQKSVEEISLGNRTMNPLFVGLSIMASFVSAIGIIGIPAEIYIYDTMYSWDVVAYCLSTVLIAFLIIPVFFRIKIVSVNEYLELRFNKALRVLATCSLLVSTGMWMGVSMYAPALAVSAVTGMSIWTSILATGIICTFYTTLGGMKAVVFTDSIQSVIMIAGIVAVIIKGTIEVGGFREMWRRGLEGHRIEFFETDPDPTILYSLWTVLIGQTTGHLRLGIALIMAQRIMACGTRKRATQALFVSAAAYAVIMTSIYMSGVVMYAYYYGCDPLSSGRVETQDQILPLMVMDLFSSAPGVPGLFLSAVAAGSLSSVSSGVNALSTAAGEDMVKALFPKMKSATYAWTLKTLGICIGVLALLFAYVTSYLGTSVVQLAISIVGIPSGPIFGVFLLGIFFHRCNGKGAFTGFICAILFVGWIKVGNILYPSTRGRNPLSVADCPVDNGTTTSLYPTIETDSTSLSTFYYDVTTDVPEQSGLINLYQISILYYYPIGLGVTVIVGMVVSALTGFQDPGTLDRRLTHTLTDALFWYLPESIKYWMRWGEGEFIPDLETEEQEMKEMDGEAVERFSYISSANGNIELGQKMREPPPPPTQEK